MQQALRLGTFLNELGGSAEAEIPTPKEPVVLRLGNYLNGSPSAPEAPVPKAETVDAPPAGQVPAEVAMPTVDAGASGTAPVTAAAESGAAAAAHTDGA